MPVGSTYFRTASSRRVPPVAGTALAAAFLSGSATHEVQDLQIRLTSRPALAVPLAVAQCRVELPLTAVHLGHNAWVSNLDYSPCYRRGVDGA